MPTAPVVKGGRVTGFVAGTALVYAAVFGMGKLALGDFAAGAGFVVVAGVLLVVVVKAVDRS